MRLEYTEWSSLPRLAWCACVRRGGDAVEVFHGPWVETRRDRFFEGAWDGSFEEGAFDRAASFFGSGAVLKDEGILFVAAMHPRDWLQAVRLEDAVLFSNSLTFLLCQARDHLDLSFSRYYHEFLRHARAGSRPGGGPFPSRGGSGFSLYNAANTLVQPDLTVAPRPKPKDGPAPGSFSELLGGLSASVGRLVRNAAHEERRQPLRPVATLSRGYDAPAVAVLGARAGCREAFSFADREAQDPDEDNGAPVGEYLDLSTRVYGQQDYLKLPNCPEAEFCASAPFGARLPLAPLAEDLAGSLVLSGLGGDHYWTLKAAPLLGGQSNPKVKLSGVAVKEFRLRSGCILAPVPYITADAHREAVYRISTSAEMRPWRGGRGDYDRPIPRRIVEEAGVPGHLFGQRKHKGLHLPASERPAMTESGFMDFKSFLETQADLDALRPLPPALAWVSAQYDRIFRWAYDLPWPLFRLLRPAVSQPLREAHSWWWASPFLFTFHWGVDRTMARYETPRRMVDAPPAAGAEGGSTPATDS